MAIDKAVDSSLLDANLTAIADAIRSKSGATDPLTMEQMATEIESLEVGGGNTDVEDGLIVGSITEYSNPRVTKIRIYAFVDFTNLTSVDFPRATSIGNYAFQNCSKLPSVDFPQATSIGIYAFRYCANLTSVDFPRATSIGNHAFRYCANLTSVDFPRATSIGISAFQDCTNLTTLILRNESVVCTLRGTNALSATPIASGTGYVYVPDALVDSYKAATNWSTYADQIKPLSDLPEEEEA